MGGGHIAAVKIPGNKINPLWEPPWITTTPAMRRIVARNFSQSEEDRLESELLACIGGHNLCCDVFGSHSKGEVNAGASFHGEAGLTTWEVTDINETKKRNNNNNNIDLFRLVLVKIKVFVFNMDRKLTYFMSITL